MNNPWMITGLTVLLCLYLAFGLMGSAKAECTLEDNHTPLREPRL